MALPVFCINRACDTEDWARFRRKAKAVGVEPIRIPAIDGHRAGAPFALYADLIGESFWGKSTAKPGALACFLSHRRAWETVLRSGAEAALICEDDVDLLVPPVAPEADLVFANDRMAGEARNVASALVALTAKAPGADCYLL
ncbi:MAG: glycosyltransferase family 25 protein, partial [Pseudomonadota bacterium]